MTTGAPNNEVTALIGNAASMPGSLLMRLQIKAAKAPQSITAGSKVLFAVVWKISLTI